MTICDLRQVDNSEDELVEAMRRRVEGFPGVEFNFSQVIQTRNDELISGINAQIAVKISGSVTRL